MKKNITILFLTFGIILISGCSINEKKSIDNSSSNSEITESEAISTIKSNYPEFTEYPSNNLPPKSIKTEKSENGWHIAFVQEGSGRPIISAKCFEIDNKKNIQSEKLYNPTVEEDTMTEFSPKTE